MLGRLETLFLRTRKWWEKLLVHNKHLKWVSNRRFLWGAWCKAHFWASHSHPGVSEKREKFGGGYALLKTYIPPVQIWYLIWYAECKLHSLFLLSLFLYSYWHVFVLVISWRCASLNSLSHPTGYFLFLPNTNWWHLARGGVTSLPPQSLPASSTDINSNNRTHIACYWSTWPANIWGGIGILISWKFEAMTFAIRVPA